MATPFRKANQTNTIKTEVIINLYDGVPLQIQRNNGSHFKGKLMQEFAQEYNIQWIFHIPYYPQAAGWIERMNDLLKQQLIKLGQGSYKNWRTNFKYSSQYFK